MSKAFADVAENDTLRITVIWDSGRPGLLTRILIADPGTPVEEFFAERGRTPVSEKALGLLLSMLGGADGRELEPLLSPEALGGFSLNVLRTLKEKVPRGRVISYGRLASLCGRHGAARAIGVAMRTNPFPLFLPCHRVVGSDGGLGGFGPGLPLKIKLLRLEGIEIENGRINMDMFGI